MRQLFFLLSFFISVAAFGQITSTQYITAPNVNGVFRGPFGGYVGDTTFRPIWKGLFVFKRSDSSLYMSVDTIRRPYWARVGSNGGNGAVIEQRHDSIFIVTKDSLYFFQTTRDTTVQLIQRHDSIFISTRDTVYYLPTAVTSCSGYSGGIIIPQGGLVLDVTQLDYYCINNKQYSAVAVTLTAAAGDATYDRQDIIVADTFGVIKIKQGTPGEIVTPPQIDPFSEFFIGNYTVKANSNEISNVHSLVIYNDPPIGWTIGSSGTITYNANNTSPPVFDGTKSLRVLDWSNGSLVFTYDALINQTDYEAMSFKLWLTSAFTKKQSLSLVLYNDNIPVTYSLPVTFNKNSTGGWQTVAVKLTDFVFTSGNQFNSVHLFAGGLASTNDFYIDLFQLTGGGVTTPGTGSTGNVYQSTRGNTGSTIAQGPSNITVRVKDSLGTFDARENDPTYGDVLELTIHPEKFPINTSQIPGLDSTIKHLVARSYILNDTLRNVYADSSDVVVGDLAAYYNGNQFTGTGYEDDPITYRVDSATAQPTYAIGYDKTTKRSYYYPWPSAGTTVDTLPLSSRITANVNAITDLQTGKLNKSDTASMLSPYLRKADTVTLSNRINLKVNISDTASMLSPYLRKADTTAMLLPYLRKADTATLSNRINLKLNISDTTNKWVNNATLSASGDSLIVYKNGVRAATKITGTGGSGGGIDSVRKAANSDSVMQYSGGTGTFAWRTRKMFNVLDYGARGDMKSGTDGAITNGSATFTSASIGFASTDVGKTIRITGAGASGVDLITTISAYTNATTVTLATTASTTVSSKTFDYGTENTSALQAAANAIPTTGGVFYVPFGKYLITGKINFVNPVRIMGELSSRGTYIFDSSGNHYTPQCGIYEMTANLPYAIGIQSSGSVWENLDLINNSGNTISQGVGLNINAGNVSIYNSFLSGFWNTVSQNYSLEWEASHNIFSGVNYGLYIRNLTSGDTGDYSIHDNLFGGPANVKMKSALRIESSGGMKISNNKFLTQMKNCVDINMSGTGTSDLQMVNNSLETFDSTGINVVTGGSTTFINMTINSNQIAPYVAHTTGINIKGASGNKIQNVTITGNNLYQVFTGDTAIKIDNANYGDIVGNTMVGTWTKTLYMGAGATNFNTYGLDGTFSITNANSSATTSSFTATNTATGTAASVNATNNLGNTASLFSGGTAWAAGTGLSNSGGVGMTNGNLILMSDWQSGSGGSHNIQLRPAGYNLAQTAMTIFSNRRVGINTTTDSTSAYLISQSAKIDSLNGPVIIRGTSNNMITVRNTTSTGFTAMNMENAAGGVGQFFKASASYSGYKNLQANDFGFANTTSGNISILNDYSSGNINFASGASSTPQLTLSSAGNSLMGTTTDDATNKLQVNGNVKASQYRLSALNAAPSSATDTGTTGEIRITSGFIYVCVATNTWVRAALSTW